MSALYSEKGKENNIEAYLYASDKARLVSMVTEMTRQASQALEKSIEALCSSDVELAQKVIDGDDLIDEMEEQIDQECLYSIAMRQPMREDLRFVYAVMKIITDIERIGDQGVNIAMRLKKIASGSQENICPMLGDIEEMTRDNLKMLDETLKAFTAEDGSLLASARENRKKTHRLRDIAVGELMKNAAGVQNPDISMLFLSTSILRHLSRVSDHILNMAEKISFIATGISPLTMKKMWRLETQESREKLLGEE